MAASIDPNFTAICKALQAQATSAAASLINTGQAYNELLGAGGIAYSDFEAICDRTGPSRDYQTAVEDTKNGQVRDLIVSKLQSDFMSCVERDLKLRHLSRIRTYTLEASRRAAHGDSNGPISSGIAYVPQATLQRDGK